MKVMIQYLVGILVVGGVIDVAAALEQRSEQKEAEAEIARTAKEAGAAAQKENAPKEGPAVFHCENIQIQSLCTDTPEESKSMISLDKTGLRARCDATGGNFGSTPCDVDDIIGSCDTPDGETVHYYRRGRGKYKLSKARKHCKNNRAGTWID